ncbi:MAG TPA: ParA family protein [Geobacteraceae bacterium]|nr:ParA family protein [Geobacteraceae bacterium]
MNHTMGNNPLRSGRYTLSLVNHKGGVGKTTTAVNLSACLGELGSRVLLVDLDPQGSASLAMGCGDDGERLFQAIQKTISLPVRATGVPGVDLVPAGPVLIGAWQRFSGALGKELLRRCLRQTEGEWDWVIIDCPPSLGVLTITALYASDGVLIPVEATHLAVTGLQQMIATIAEVARSNFDRRPKLQGIVPCRAHPRRRIHGLILDRLEKAYPGMIAPCVRESVSLAESPSHGKPIITFASSSNGARDYRAVAEWVSLRSGVSPV